MSKGKIFIGVLLHISLLFALIGTILLIFVPKGNTSLEKIVLPKQAIYYRSAEHSTRKIKSSKNTVVEDTISEDTITKTSVELITDSADEETPVPKEVCAQNTICSTSSDEEFIKYLQDKLNFVSYEDASIYFYDMYKWSCKLCNNEAGADYCSDEEQQYVLYVLYNRIDSDLFPDDIYSVIHDGGYALDNINKEYNERVEKNVRIALANYFTGQNPLPPDTVFEALFKQKAFGQDEFLVQKEFYHPELGNTTYICRAVL